MPRPTKKGGERKSYKRHAKTCEWCGREYMGTMRQRFCCAECRDAERSGKSERWRESQRRLGCKSDRNARIAVAALDVCARERLVVALFGMSNYTKYVARWLDDATYNRRPHGGDIRVCPVCGKEFRWVAKNQLYCCDAHRRVAQDGMKATTETIEYTYALTAVDGMAPTARARLIKAMEKGAM